MGTFVFFQNCVSPHQMPYIEALSRREDVEHVWVIAPRLAYNERAAMGWPTTWTQSSEKLGILIAPTDEEVKNILNESSQCQRQSQCHCLFSGITAFPEIKHWLDLSLSYNVKRGIITEMPYVYDKPLWMHRLRFLLKDLRYVKYFDYVFAIGEDCEKYYRSWSKHWNVVPFMYCTQLMECAAVTTKQTELNLCFVGTLDRRKNVKVLLQALSLIKDKKLNITIVGDGPENDNLRAVAPSTHSVSFVGSKPMEEAKKIIANNDVLILPSLHDGWGAVINEAMILGTVPVCSDKCGAKALIKQSGFGQIFDVNKPKELAQILTDMAENIANIRSQRAERILWAKKNISPEAVAEKFYEGITVHSKS